jgi:hypothetical protein
MWLRRSAMPRWSESMSRACGGGDGF